MKYLTQFANQAAFNAAKGSLDRPGVSLITDGGIVKYLKELAKVGDYLFSDLTFGSTVGAKTPIAICVAPATHFADEKARWISLVNMSATDPEHGTTATGNDSSTNDGAGFCWGYNEAAVGTTDDTLPTLVCTEANVPTTSLSESTVSDGAYLPSDYFNSENINIPVEYPFDENLHYYGDDEDMDGSSYGALVSPFGENGALNPWSRLHALSNERGDQLTAAIIAEASLYSTGVITRNDYSEGSYPAAMACHRFFTAGTQAGDWYLPAIAELQYLMPNLNVINAKLTALSSLAVAIGNYETQDTLGGWLWSSSEYSVYSAWYLDTYGGGVTNYDKNYDGGNGRVRAFLAY